MPRRVNKIVPLFDYFSKNREGKYQKRLIGLGIQTRPPRDRKRGADPGFKGIDRGQVFYTRLGALNIRRK